MDGTVKYVQPKNYHARSYSFVTDSLVWGCVDCMAGLITVPGRAVCRKTCDISSLGTRYFKQISRAELVKEEHTIPVPAMVVSPGIERMVHPGSRVKCPECGRMVPVHHGKLRRHYFAPIQMDSAKCIGGGKRVAI